MRYAMDSKRKIVTLFLIFLLISSVVAWGQSRTRNPASANQLLITAVQFDSASNSLVIFGQNLGSSASFKGTVKLFAPTKGTLQLAVLGFDPTKQQLRVALPSGVNLSGTLRLTVSTGSGAPMN